MKEHVTVIPSDGIVIVDGTALPCVFTPHIENLHAIQWHNGSGEIEINAEGFMSNRKIASYETDVKPYVALWQAAFDAMKGVEQAVENRERPGWWKSFWRKLTA